MGFVREQQGYQELESKNPIVREIMNLQQNRIEVIGKRRLTLFRYLKRMGSDRMVLGQEREGIQ